MVHSYLLAKPNCSLQSNARVAWSNWISSIKYKDQNYDSGFLKKIQFSPCQTTACNQVANSYFFLPRCWQKIITYRELPLRSALFPLFYNQRWQHSRTSSTQADLHRPRGHCVCSSLTSKPHFCCHLTNKDLLIKFTNDQYVCIGFVQPNKRQNLRFVRSRLWRTAGWMGTVNRSTPSPTSPLPAQIPLTPPIWIKLFQFILIPCFHSVSKKPLLKCHVWI